jgi:hypothetical protein
MVRLTDIMSRRRVRKTGVADRQPARTRRQPLDRDFTFDRDGHHWTFEDGRIYIEGQEVNEVVNSSEDLALWLGVIGGLTDYKQFVLNRTQSPSESRGFFTVIDAMLDKLMGKTGKFYRDKLFGVSWKLDRGELVINGINIHSFLALYEQRKTAKAKSFLIGLRDKVQMILANKAGSHDNERIRETAEKLSDRIKVALGDDGASSPPLLNSGRPPR